MSVLDLAGDFAPVMGAPIEIPANMIFFRGYDVKYPVISNRVTHYGSEETARGYANASDDHRLGIFTTTIGIRVLDLRYIQVLLKQLFKTRKTRAISHIEPMARMTLSYGLCGLRDQLELMNKLMGDALGTRATQEYYDRHISNKAYSEMPVNVNPFTPDGIRVGETSNDALSLIFLKEIFGKWVAGFVAPRFESPFHVEKGGFITPEIVLFDPMGSRIQQLHLPEIPRHPKLSIDAIANHRSHCQWFELRDIHRTSVRHAQSGGGKKATGYTPDTTDFFDQVEAEDKEAVREANKMIRFAKSVGENIRFIDPYAVHPTLPLTPWC